MGTGAAIRIVFFFKVFNRSWYDIDIIVSTETNQAKCVAQGQNTVMLKLRP